MRLIILHKLVMSALCLGYLATVPMLAQAQDTATDDRWKFKTPTLRNIALTRPYMHNGQLSSLKRVIRFYNQGGSPNPDQSPLIRPLGLSDAEIDDLLAFLNSLTGDNVDELISANRPPH